MSRMAIAALAFGFVGFIPPFSIVAWWLGDVAWGRIKRSGGALLGEESARAGMWLGFGFFLLQLLAIAVFYPLSSPVTRAGRSAHRSCVSNLKQVGLGMQMYMADYAGELPPSLQVLWSEGYTKDPSLYRCGLRPRGEQFDCWHLDDAGDFSYARPRTPPAGRPALPIAWEKRAHPGETTVPVLFDDGTVTRMDVARFAAVLDADAYESPPKPPALSPPPPRRHRAAAYWPVPVALILLVAVVRQRRRIAAVLARLLAPLREAWP